MCPRRRPSTMRVMSSTSTHDLSSELRSLWRTRPVRTPDDSKIAGVAGGFGRRYGIDPVLVRVAFVIAALWGGAGVFLYALLWLFLRYAGDEVSSAESLLGRGQSSGSKFMAVVLVVVVLISAPTFGGSGATFFVGAGFLMTAAMLAGWYGLHRRMPEPPAGWAQEAAVRPPDHAASTPWARAGDEHAPHAGAPFGPGAHPNAAPGSHPNSAPGTRPNAAHPHSAHAHGPAADRSQVPGSGPDAPHGPPVPPSWDPLGAAPFAWDLPEPGIHVDGEEPRGRKPKSRLTKITLGLALIAVAVATGLSALGNIGWLDTTRIAAIALAVVAGGLLIGAITRRGHGLLVLAGPLAGFVLLASLIQVPEGGWESMGEKTFEITTPARLEQPITHEVGSITVDMRGLELDRTRDFKISNDVGSVDVILPEDLAVNATCTADAGSVDCPDPADLTGAPDGEPVLNLNISSGLGSVKVTR